MQDHNLIAVLQDSAPPDLKRNYKSFCNFRIENGYFAIMMTPPLDCISAVNNLLTNAAATIYDLQFHFVIEKSVASSSPNADEDEATTGEPEHCSNY